MKTGKKEKWAKELYSAEAKERKECWRRLNQGMAHRRIVGNVKL
jgi:hypothetical protein